MSRRRRSLGFRVVLFGTAAVFVVAGCASSPRLAGAGDPDITSVQSVQRYPALGLTLAPPPAGSTTALTARQIVAMCNGDATCPTDRSTAVLALGSATTDAMSRIEADGSSVRTIDDRLVVAMTFAHAQCMADAGPGENTAVPSPHGCIWVVLVDAGSGHMLTSMSAGMPG